MLEQEASKTAIDPMNAMILLKLKFSLFSLTNLIQQVQRGSVDDCYGDHYTCKCPCSGPMYSRRRPHRAKQENVVTDRSQSRQFQIYHSAPPSLHVLTHFHRIQHGGLHTDCT